jgi:tRNA nucleotidyltransferase/poly(A) polymerase
MKIFLVGGAVRDLLLGREPKDKDYVVVGSSPSQLLELGFKQVGASFPVFLHPETGEEYALARKEKKVAPGYQGFEFEFGPHVTLYDDLKRRDLTINSIAKDVGTGEIFDPFGGQHDLAQGIIRHTSEAFAEDPLRVLRVARFAARYNFKVANDTVDLCKQLVQAGEIDALSADRIWAELAKIFTEKKPSIAFKFLEQVEALETPRLKNLVFQPVVTYKDNDLEEKLTVSEKIYFQLAIHFMTKKQIEDHRIPLDVVADVKFMNAFYDVIDAAIQNMPIDQLIVNMFNSFREPLKAGRFNRFIEMIIIFNEHLNGGSYNVFVELTKAAKIAFEELAKLNFTEMTKGMKNGDEIKFLVNETKLKTVKKSLDDY